MSKTFIEILKSEEIEKFNPYHDRLGRFTFGSGFGMSSSQYTGDKSRQAVTFSANPETTAGANAIARHGGVVPTAYGWNDGKPPEKPKEESSKVKDKYESKAAAIKDIEAKIRTQNYESAAIVDNDGKVLLFKDGAKSSVTFARNESAMMSGNTLTHNHPSSSMFSLEDMKTFVNRNIGEIRAAGNEGKTYSLKRTTYNENRGYYDIDREYKFLQAYSKARVRSISRAQQNLDERGFRDKILSGKLSQDKANKEMNGLITKHLTSYMSRYAKTYGFEFSVEEG